MVIMNVTHSHKSSLPMQRRQVAMQNMNIDRMPVANCSIKKRVDATYQQRLEKLKLSTSISMKTPIPICNKVPGTSSNSAKPRKSSTPYNTGPTDTSTTPGTGSSIVIAITEGRGDARGEVGMAVMNVQLPHLILSQISDRQTYLHTLAKILVFKPMEIIMPDTMVGTNGNASKLYECIKEKFQGLNITAVARKHFNDEIGLDRIKSLCAREYLSVEIYIRHKFYAQAAAAALLKYVEFNQHILFVPRAMKIEFQSSEKMTVIDVASAESLELVTAQVIFNKCTLMSILDRCVTPEGKRYLRASILQPPSNEELIMSRQSCVAEMVNDSTLQTSVQSLIRKLSSVDRLLVLGLNYLSGDSISCAEKNLNYILLLKNTLEIIPVLETALQNANADFFKQVRKNLQDPRFEFMTKIITRTIQSEARYTPGFVYANIQRCFALKSGINDMLDIARQAYCELIDDMTGLVEALARKFNLSFSLECSASLGYHIVLDASKHKMMKANDLPPVFIEVQKRKNNYYMTTEDLLVFSQRCKDACEEVHLMSNAMLTTVLNDLREHIGCLYQLSADVSELDVVLSLARISSNVNYTRPIFGSRMEVINSVHPVMDINGTCIPVGNNVYASLDHNFNIITGPNMGGKSVYLRQIVMLQIMAQIGCYVPAEKAQFRIADHILCRICFGDSIDCNASSFVLEMKETQYISQMLTSKSLVIMDELCRGTNKEEGESIAFAICERLLNTSAFTFFTTHFISLARLSQWYPNVENYHFETKFRQMEGSNESRLIYTHKLKPGVVFAKHYGLALANSSETPLTILSMARQMAAKLDNQTNIHCRTNDTQSTWTKKCYDEISKIYKQIQDGQFSTKQLIESIKQFKAVEIGSPMLKIRSNQLPTAASKNCQSEQIGDIVSKYENSREIQVAAVKKNPEELILSKFFDQSDDLSCIRKRCLSKFEANSYMASKDVANIDYQPPCKVFVTPKTSQTVWENDARVTLITPRNESKNERFGLLETTPSFCETETRVKMFNWCEEMDADNDHREPSVPCSSQGSGSSLDTMAAKISARKKEASIFRIIEGDNFQASRLYGSVLSNNSSRIIDPHEPSEAISASVETT